MLRTKVETDPRWADRTEQPWKDLQSKVLSATPFQTWEWQSTWFRHFHGRQRARIWMAYEGDDLVALMPFVLTRTPWRVLKPMGSGCSDYLEPLIRPGFEDQANQALVEFLSDPTTADLIDLHQLREGCPLVAELPSGGDRPSLLAPQATCLKLDLPETYEAYVRGLSKSLRYDVKRLDRMAVGQAQIHLAHRQNAEAMFLEFLSHHQARWKRRGLPGAFVGKRRKNFHREWVVRAAEAGILRLGSLRVDGNSVGAIYAMAWGKSCYFYQSGFDPAYKSLSPGTLLVADAIRRSIDEGLEVFDFLRGDEPYKRRWKPQNVEKNLRYLSAAPTLPGRLALAASGTGFKLEGRLRARFEGRGLV